jgi:hypothetical protein
MQLTRCHSTRIGRKHVYSLKFIFSHKILMLSSSERVASSIIRSAVNSRRCNERNYSTACAVTFVWRSSTEREKQVNDRHKIKQVLQSHSASVCRLVSAARLSERAAHKMSLFSSQSGFSVNTLRHISFCAAYYIRWRRTSRQENEENNHATQSASLVNKGNWSTDLLSAFLADEYLFSVPPRLKYWQRFLFAILLLKLNTIVSSFSKYAKKLPLVN